MATSAQAFAALARLSPEDALAYLKARGQITQSWSWADLWQEEHTQQFTVSRLANVDLLKDVQAMITASVNGDMGRKDFMRDAKAALEAKGWWSEKTMIDQATGREVTTTFNPERLKLIFDTNTRQAYAAGQWERIQASKASHPYIRYVTKGDERVRASHAQWNNVTLPVDDSFWHTHTPPNAWRCRCRIVSVSQREYDRGRTPNGATMIKTAPPVQLQDWTNPRTGEISQVPVGVHPAFAYNPGMSRTVKLQQVVLDKFATLPAELADAVVKSGLVKPSGAKELAGQDTWQSLGLKDLREFKGAAAPELLDSANSSEAALAVLREVLGIDPAGSVAVDTPAGKVLLRDASLPHVVEKASDARERYAKFIKPTLEQPSEIWKTAYDDGSDRNRYIKVFEGSKYEILVVVMLDEGGNIFWNMIPRNIKDMNKLRVGQLIHQGEGV